MASLSTQPESVMQVPEADVKGFGIATALQQLRKDPNLSDAEKKNIIDVIVSSQNAALLGHLERIYKLTDMGKFLDAARNITSHLENLDLDDLASVFQQLKPSTTDQGRTETDACWHGFNPQLHLDLIATRVMLLVGVESKAGKISCRLVALAGVVSSLSTKVSPRLRCYHSGVGFKSNPVKALWKNHRRAGEPSRFWTS